MSGNQKQTPMPPASAVASRAQTENKKQIIQFLLTHEVDMPFSARELAKLPLAILLREKVEVRLRSLVLVFHLVFGGLKKEKLFIPLMRFHLVDLFACLAKMPVKIGRAHV